MSKRLYRVLLISNQGKDITPGQRFRIEQYLSFLKQNNFKFEFSPIMKVEDNKYLYSSGNFFRKFFILLKSFWVRFLNLIDLRRGKYDLIFIYRDALMIGSVFFEKQFKKTGVPIVYDFDDAIWLSEVSEANRKFSWMKNPEKTKKIISLSSFVTVGNDYLAEYAQRFNKNIVVIPTTIDTNYHIPASSQSNSQNVCIGWTGSVTTTKYFKSMFSVLKRIKDTYPNVKFLLIGDASFVIEDLDLQTIPWNFATEITDLQQIDIGIMPLSDDEWAKGKCGFKALQYMAIQIPCVVSPYGVNSEIVEDGVNGFIATNEDEWFEKLSILIENSDLRNRLGKAGRQTVIERYSVDSNKAKWLEVFNSLKS